MRIILITGKGGVGKTTVSGATALMAADRGYRTLVMSTDSDLFKFLKGMDPNAVGNER